MAPEPDTTHIPSHSGLDGGSGGIISPGNPRFGLGDGRSRGGSDIDHGGRIPRSSGIGLGGVGLSLSLDLGGSPGLGLLWNTQPASHVRVERV